MDGSTFRLERQSLGLSQANIARVSHIKQAKISAWELGKIELSLDEISKVQDVVSEVKKGSIPEGILLRNFRKPNAIGLSQSSSSNINTTPLNQTLSDQNLHAGEIEESRIHIPFSTTDNAKRDFFLKSGKPKVLACFAGCGGMSLGFLKAGFDIIGFIEIDKAATKTFQRNFQHSILLAQDIRAVKDEHVKYWKELLGPIDVMCGGPPCQGFSLAGKRDRDDPRNTLFRNYLRIANVLRPRAIVMENVRLLTSMRSADGKPVIDQIMKEFEKIGYNATFRELDAKDYGVPQSRGRVFFIAIRDSKLSHSQFFPSPTHGPRSNINSQSSLIRQYVTFREATGDLERLEAGEKSHTDIYHWAVKHPAHVINWLKAVPEGMSAHDNSEPTLRPTSGYNTTYKRIRWDEPCSTIGTTFSMISACRTVHPADTRSLTVREAMRCQTFPDGFEFHGTWTQIRTQIGNAVPPLLAYVIANHLKTIICGGIDE